MLILTMLVLGNFMTFFFIAILYFALTYHMFGVSFDDGDYPHLWKFVVTLIQTFRNSIGDIAVLQYDDWTSSDESKLKKGIIVALVWIFWFLLLVFNLTVLLNFLIAVISQVYDQVISCQLLCQYKYMADFNREYYII